MSALSPALSVLDQVPVLAGRPVADAIHASIDLARHAERWGYARHWFAEHHLGPGRAGAAPLPLIALAAGATQRIGLGSAASVLPHHGPLGLVEEFATVAEVHPGRVTLGLGRGNGFALFGGSRAAELIVALGAAADPGVARIDRVDTQPAWDILQGLALVPDSVAETTRDDSAGTLGDRRLRQVLRLLTSPVAVTDGLELRASPGLCAPLGVAVFGGPSGASAAAAARLGLPLYVNAHSIPYDIAASVAGYRAAFVPSRWAAEPYVGVSTHAVLAESDAEARLLETSYRRTLSSLSRSGAYEVILPPDRDYVADEPGLDLDLYDRTAALSIAGSPQTVLTELQRRFAPLRPDEVLVSTIVFDPAARLRSYELLADAWTAAAWPSDDRASASVPVVTGSAGR